MKKKGIGGHQKTVGDTDVWLTPPEIIKSLGEFDLDPCAPVNRIWDTAKHHYTVHDDGLKQHWFGRIWLNPPYNRYLITHFLKKMSEHANGIALVFARTDREDFHKYIFSNADSILFRKQRITFIDQDGNKAPANGGAPNMFAAWGNYNVEALATSGIEGKLVFLNAPSIIVVGVSPSWKSVITISFNRIGGTGTIDAIYEVVERVAPDKVAKNANYKAKVRQKLQQYFTRVKRGVYTVTV